jgi:hypothetical protein
MVRIDNVYQRVLALANKEQRGYITPQEFNLFANHAQKEIFEQYFYELNQFLRIHGNSEEYSDIIDNIREKISIFERTASSSNPIVLGNEYRLGTIYTNDNIEVQEVQSNELLYINKSPLLRPTPNRPVYVRQNNVCTVFPQMALTSLTYTFIAEPTRANWGYTVNNGNAMYNPSTTIDFELHTSEENELVYKILSQAGVSIQRQDIAQAAMAGQAIQSQQEKQ